MTRAPRPITIHQSDTVAGKRRTRLRILEHFVALAISATLLLSTAACYQYRAIARTQISLTDPGGSIGGATEEKGELVVSYLWGLLNENPTIDNCHGEDLYEVTMETNLGFTLVKVATLGIVAPVIVKWRCAKPKDTEGDIPVIGPGSDGEKR